MKRLKKITSLFCILLTVVTFGFAFTNSANAANSSITVSRESRLPNFIDAYEFFALKANDGTIVYCYDGHVPNWPTSNVPYTKA